MRHLVLAAPGDLEQRTGGYLYDRQAAAALAARGWAVNRLSLPELSTMPRRGELAAAERALAAIADDSLLLVDGLALGKLPAAAGRHARRLRLAGLVHHPLFLEGGLPAELATALRCSEAEALAHARAVVCTSPATAAALSRDLGVDPARITVAVPGVEPAAPARGGGGGRLRMLYVATVTPRKAHTLLIAALRGLGDLDWELFCAGSLERDPAAARVLVEAVAAAGLAGRVRLVGEVDGPGLADLYDSTDVVVSSSLYEGYGMALAEAVARGLPIVAAAGGAVADTVPAGAGIMVPPGDEAALSRALRDILSDAALRARMRDAALSARSGLPRWADTAEAIERALEELS